MTMVFYTNTHTHTLLHIYYDVYSQKRHINMAEIDREGFIEVHSELNHTQY